MAAIAPTVWISNAPPVKTPAYSITFTYNGNWYQLSGLLVATSATDSADLDATMTTMVDALSTGYTSVGLVQFSTEQTTLV